MGVLEEKDVAMTFPVVLGMVTSHSMVDLNSLCGTEHEDSPFVVVIRLSFSFCMYGWMRFLLFFFSMYLFRILL